MILYLICTPVIGVLKQQKADAVTSGSRCEEGFLGTISGKGSWVGLGLFADPWNVLVDDDPAAPAAFRFVKRTICGLDEFRHRSVSEIAHAEAERHREPPSVLAKKRR